MEKNKCINFFKGIACLGVVLIHCNFLNNQTIDILKDIARFAVPFFLMVSGYFLYNSDRTVRIKKLKKQFLKILILTITICAIYFFWNFFKMNFNPEEINNWLNQYLLNPEFTKILLLFNRWAFLASTVYYLFMLIYVYIIDYIATKLHLNKLLYFASLILIAFGVYTQYTNPQNLDWYYWGNWFLTGLPFLEFGSFIAWLKDKEKLYCNNFFAIFLFILGIGLSIATVLIKNTFLYYDIGSVLIASSALIFSIKNPKWYIFKPLEILGEKYSLDIFMLHIIVRDTIEKYMQTNSIEYSYKWCLIIIGLSILLGILVRTPINLVKRLFKFLKNKFASDNL